VSSNGHWRDYAVCQTVDPELFFPDGPGGATKAKAEQAKRVCKGCPVRRECLDWAFETGQHHGVLGGLTQEERLEFRRVTQPLSVHRRPAIDRCIQARGVIEEMRAQGHGFRAIARRIGVGRDVLRKAVYLFDEEAAEQGVAA
jgi:WhiB family redox-sensing transcriptional regulator